MAIYLTPSELVLLRGLLENYHYELVECQRQQDTFEIYPAEKPGYFEKSGLYPPGIVEVDGCEANLFSSVNYFLIRIASDESYQST